ncbi:Conserved oligomeric Golgi complex subunit 3 [Echinococcus granulosus]|uniref:Conserved oligomeric Golgi complex subunit 3 n=1 Tax=Echinococcus granulosus TaxID=6210 RepID=A0A068WQF5_ECHGR|nr:Conserved oligomeric Golgi complex subunit 3 [Echinococcus granulosus]CDS22037.1 oligomeric golgi complex subunit 3 [Echinococcus granulosus]
MCAAENILEEPKCLLSEKQLESIYYLSSEDYRPLPQKPRDRLDSEQVPQEGQEIVEIELASQFYAWLSSPTEIGSADGSQAEVDLLTHFLRQESYCTSIISKTDEILSILYQLKEKYHSVSEKTNNLHETCESLLRKQTDLTEKANQIEEMLQFFTVLSSIESPNFKDSEAFLLRFNTCLNSALLMVKEGIKNSIRQVVIEIVELGDAISPENSFILLYGRFRSQASRIRSLMQLMESRADKSPRYRDVIAECQAYYLTKREALVIPVARASIADLTSKYSGDHCELFRTTVSFMLHMVEDESLLFWRYFESQETVESSQVGKNPPSFESMLTNLCSCVYDALRPFLIHVNHIEILMELCDLLVHEFIEDKPAANPNVDLAVFENMCRTLLADVQQRLIYRAHVHIKSQIHDYEPSAGDITYPEKLEMIEQIASSLQQQQQQQQANDGDVQSNGEAERKISSSSTDFHGMWYPTVRRTLVCISGLSRCLDVKAFQGLAQNCLSACIESLMVAQKRIEARRSTSDGQLFFIKHLLILREQSTPFNVDFRVRETSLDFSNIKSAAYQAMPKLGLKIFDFNRANHLLRLLLLEGPTVVDTDVDSRRQLDRHLKVTCEAFISASVTSLTGQIGSLLDKAKVQVSQHPVLGAPNQLRDEVSAAIRLLSVSESNSSSAANTLAVIRHKLTLYLGNTNTVAIILRPIENGVVKLWRKLAATIAEHYSEEERMVIACPTENQIRLFFHANRSLSTYLVGFSLEWLLDRQDVLKYRAPDLKKLGSEEEYQKIMIFFIDVIQAFGKSVEVRQQVIATASVYFRRFFGRTSLKSIDPWLMAPSCLFLASKVEEYGVIQPKSLIAACCKVVNNQYSKYFKEYTYPYRTHDVFECEFILMEAMDCSLIVFHPYRPLLQFCDDLRPQLLDMADELLSRAWSIANDSLRTDLCLHYPPYLIALGCVQMALVSLARNPPASSGNIHDHHSLYFSTQSSINPLVIAEQWFSELNIDAEKVLEVVRHLLALYDLLDRIDMENEMPVLLMQKMPHPVVQQPPQQQAQGQQGASRAIDGGNGGGAATSHHKRMGQAMPTHHMPPPPHPPPNAAGGPPM